MKFFDCLVMGAEILALSPSDTWLQIECTHGLVTVCKVYVDGRKINPYLGQISLGLESKCCSSRENETEDSSELGLDILYPIIAMKDDIGVSSNSVTSFHSKN